MRKGILQFSKGLVSQEPDVVAEMLEKTEFVLEKELPQRLVYGNHRNEVDIVRYIGTSPMFDTIPDDTQDGLLPEYYIILNIQIEECSATVTKVLDYKDGSLST